MSYTYKEYRQIRFEIINNTHLEVPPTWVSLTKSCLLDILNLVNSEGLDIREFTFEQVKEKYGELRVYYTTPYYEMMLDESIDDSELSSKDNDLRNQIDEIIGRYNDKLSVDMKS